MNKPVFLSVLVATAVTVPIIGATGLHGPLRWLTGGLISAAIALLLLTVYKAVARSRG